MNKRGALAVGQILVLIFGIIAIGWIVGSEIGVVRADISKISFGEDYSFEKSPSTSIPVNHGNDLGIDFKLKDPKAVTNTKTPHGYAGEFWEWVTGEPIQVKTAAYSATGIIQGAGWALTVYGVIKMIGGFVDDEGAVTNALASGAAAGVFAGKS